MATLIKTDGTQTVVQPKNGTDFKLEELQTFVGGYIEILHSRSDDTIMVINEEGMIQSLPESQRDD